MRVLLFSRTPQTGVVDHSFLSERHERSNGHGIAQETDRLNGGTGSVLFLLHYDGQGVAPTGQVLSWARTEERRKPLVFRPCGECHKVFNAYTAERLRAADTFLIGRVSFELFNSFWPQVAQNPDSEEWTAEQREISRAGQSVPTVVVSDTLPDWLPEKLPETRLIRRAERYRQIAHLKRPAGKAHLMKR